MEKIALYAGSFNPPTKGHLDIISRASEVCNKLIIGVGVNTRKKTILSPEERVALLKKATAKYKNVEVASYEGLTVNYARNTGVTILIRGLRNSTDFQMEFHMAVTNKTLFPKLETIFLMSTPALTYINSFIVREVAAAGGEIAHFVPKEIVEDLEKIFEERRSVLAEFM